MGWCRAGEGWRGLARDLSPRTFPLVLVLGSLRPFALVLRPGLRLRWRLIVPLVEPGIPAGPEPEDVRCNAHDMPPVKVRLESNLPARLRPWADGTLSPGLVPGPGVAHPYLLLPIPVSRIQVLTAEELLQGGRIDYPSVTGANVTFRRAPKARGKKDAEQLGMNEVDGPRDD